MVGGIASSVTNKIGRILPYYDCLGHLIKKKKQNSPFTLRTDQGSVYSSTCFYQVYKDLILSVRCHELKYKRITHLLSL